MGIQFFGEFLIDRWVITRGQLIEALELQEYRNLKFGEVAMQKKYLSEEQVKRINDEQKRQDIQFADLAVALGELNEAQAREILTLQKNNHLFLGESLLELGHVTEDILERELSIFKEEQARYALEKVEILDEVPGSLVLEVSVDLTRKMFHRVVGLLLKVGPGQIEKEAGTVSEARDLHLTVGISYIGSTSVLYLLSVSSELAVTIATSMLREDASDEPEEVIEDAVREFANMVCGNAAAKLAQLGQEVDIAPPETYTVLPSAPADKVVVAFPAHLTEGELDLRFFVPSS